MLSRSSGLIRPHHPMFALLHRMLDSALVLFALAAAAYAYDGDMRTDDWLAGLLAVLAFQVAGEVTHLYASWRVYSLRQELSELFLVCVSVAAFLLIAAFFAKLSVQYSRVVMLLWWLKRLEDLLIATAAIVVTAPLMLSIALGVKLCSPGPVLFRQRRYGLSGKVVEVWKFRSMRVG